jgi:serine/threonine protein kinase
VALKSIVAELRYQDYHLERLIGAGGTSKVYVATHRVSGQVVAVKVLRKRLRSRPHLVERFLREAQVVAGLRHSGIVPIHGMGRFPDGNFFLVLDLIDGGDLTHLLKSGPISWTRAAQIVVEVARALQHVHQHGVIHRDLKPQNVLIDSRGQVFVSDFGFAWQNDDAVGEEHAIVGTAGFMAPEQIEPGLGPVGPHTDVFGLGALLWMLCTGKPFGEQAGELASEIEIPSAHHSSNVRAVDAKLPDAIATICERCMHRDYQLRPQSAAQLADLLTSAAKI